VTALAAEAEAPAITVGRPHDAGAMKRLFEPSEVTLEETILGAWEALTAHGRAECPVCHGELERGGCATCGSSLS
jgi:DnaJ-class molecular chaperone